jgi:shikimate dehydrogenase
MATMDRYAVLGNPVAHSKSPAIHTMFAAQTGEAVEYTRVLCPMDGFEASVRAFAAEGGRGCNVTVPFKFDAPGLAATVSERARRAGAANVLRFDQTDGWFADNTDGIGLVRDIELNAARPIEGQRVLLIGAGGAAAGELGPLLERRPAALVVANRTHARAQALVDRHPGASTRPLDDCGAPFDVVINASASSLQGAAVPVAPGVLRPGALAVDLMYGALSQGFLGWAAAHGAVPRDGLGMLVEQAAEAFFVWRGVRPATAPVLAALARKLALPR